MGLAPEDRKSQALLLEWDLTKNVTLPDVSRFQRGVIRVRAEREAAETQLAALHTTPSDGSRRGSPALRRQPAEGGAGSLAAEAVHCDITSLYPSIMLSYECFPAHDVLGVFPSLLHDLREFRVQAKGLARQANNPVVQRHYDALQATFKILINSFYGYLGFSLGHFNDFAQADRVTRTGREIIQHIVVGLEGAGCRIIEVDTDGLYFMPPAGVRTPEDEERLLSDVSQGLPTGISLELDGHYPAMFSYKMKNYALLDERGEVILKGSGLKSRGLEPYPARLDGGDVCACCCGEKRTRSTRCWPSIWRSSSSTNSM